MIKINVSAKCLGVLLVLLMYSIGTKAFTCHDITGNELSYTGNNNSANVYVNLTPTLLPGQVLVVDLSQSISCRNDSFIIPPLRNDIVTLLSGSAFGGALTNFSGTVNYYGQSYPFPLTTETSGVNNQSASFTSWNAMLYLTPISTASSVLIEAGTKIATMTMKQIGSNASDGQDVRTLIFYWNIYANNSVIVPTGGCDVSSRDVTVTLPDYPGTVPVPLTVHCAQNQDLAYYLTGPTTDVASTIFTNTASSSAAQGIGIQLSNSNGIIATNENIALGSVGINPVSLGMTATYARTTGQVVAGNVTSIVGVTFLYQ